jgi:pyroglutamyl-peptidase
MTGTFAPVTVLVTGFGPFPGMPANPTAALVQRLGKRRQLRRPGVRVITHVFATRYDTIDLELPRLLNEHRPDALVMFGVAGRTRHVRIETSARSAQSVLLADAGGGVVAVSAGNAQQQVMRGRAPFVQLVSSFRSRGIDARLSYDAGRYLCNYVYRQALTSSPSPAIVVFIHVPRLRGGARPRRRVKRSRIAPDALLQAAEAAILTMPGTVRSMRRMS